MHPPHLGAEALSSTLLAHGTRWGPLRARDLGGGSSDLVRQQQQWHCRHHERRWRRRRWWRRRRAGIGRSAAPRLHRRNRLASRKSSRHGVGAAHCSLGDAICDGAHETGGCWLDAATLVESPTSPSKMNFCEGSFLKRLDSKSVSLTLSLIAFRFQRRFSSCVLGGRTQGRARPLAGPARSSARPPRSNAPTRSELRFAAGAGSQSGVRTVLRGQDFIRI